MKTLFFGFIAVAVVLFLFTRIVEPPNQLDYLDRVWPGQSNAEKLASDITFDEASAQKLNIWGSPAPAVHHKKPVLVFFYGGGWANGDRDHYGFAARAYANRGFVVVLPDYRKVPDVHFPAFNQDAAAAVRWVHDNIGRYGGDPDRIVLAGRVRVGSILGARTQSIAPSRRFYSGGGGSVRGYGYQLIGPRDAANTSIVGRSLTEFAVEARVRLGSFGIVPFLDGGNIYTSPMPKFSKFRLGTGLGARYYSSFGPIRIDIGTPLNRQPGDSRITVAVSLGQAF